MKKWEIIRDYRSRQDAALEAANVPASVAHAMDLWALSMRGGSVGRGYPTGSSMFASGGITCFDDMDKHAEEYAAKAVAGVMKSFDTYIFSCYSVMWLGAAERPFVGNRVIDVDKTVIATLPIIWRKLIEKGVA